MGSLLSVRMADRERTVRYGPRVSPPAGESLTVVSGYPDDRRKKVGPSDRMYAIATYAFAHRDYWTDEESRLYWRAHLHLWPSRAGRSSNVESLAFAIVNAESIGVPPDDLRSQMRYSTQDLRDRHVLELVDRMRDELDRGPSAVRVPRVVTVTERDGMPLLTAHQLLDAADGAANVNVGEAARSAVRVGAREAARWCKESSHAPQRRG